MRSPLHFLLTSFAKRKLKTTEHTFLKLVPDLCVTVMIDCSEEGWAECAEAVERYSKQYSFKAEVVYLGLRKSPRSALSSTPGWKTITDKDLNWFGKPSSGKVAGMLTKHCDIFICLVGKPSYPAEYFAINTGAMFKIGRYTVSESVFDMIVTDPSQQYTQKDALDYVIKYWKTVV